MYRPTVIKSIRSSSLESACMYIGDDVTEGVESRGCVDGQVILNEACDEEEESSDATQPYLCSR